MSKLLIISNRLPINIVKRKSKLHFQPSAGGLATGLNSFHKSKKTLWIGWPGITLENLKGEERDIQKLLKAEKCYPVFLSQNNIKNYYNGFCNKTLWPLFQYFPQYTIYKESFWKSYKQVNKVFCDTVMKIAETDDTIWVHDYHLMLLPKLIREKLSDATIGFFLHTPFPSFEIFRLLPWREDILNGLLGADLIGFHIYDYVRHFLESIHRLLGSEHTIGHIIVDKRLVKVDAFPMGIDYDRFAYADKSPTIKREMKRIRKKMNGRKVILSIDRLDYTKGIPLRLEEFDVFLQKNPKYRENVILILVVVPSRTRVEQYTLLKKQVDELVGRINGKYGTFRWTPIWYLYRNLPFHTLVALYHVADVALITPLRGGMNLIAKEFIATKTKGKGVLILSEMVGAAKELGEAIVVNPNNKEEVIEALKKALTMSSEEQIVRNRTMQKRLQSYNVVRWAENFMNVLLSTKKVQQKLYVKKLTFEIKKKLVKEYSKRSKRLILLDYDGTLVPFAESPEKAKPDDELLTLLETLASVPENEVVIISGRDRDTLEKWFGNLNLALIAEHGVWIKEKEKAWEIIEHMNNDWKEEVRPVLELYTDRTPGSFIEEKEFSLVWHHRNVDPDLGSVRKKELKDVLLQFTSNLNLEILEGNKAIEIKNANINKGRASQWILKNDWDFILAIGDDRTDENIFNILPKSAYSIKVGLTPTQAKFNLNSVKDTRLLLKELALSVSVDEKENKQP